MLSCLVSLLLIYNCYCFIMTLLFVDKRLEEIQQELQTSKTRTADLETSCQQAYRTNDGKVYLHVYCNY